MPAVPFSAIIGQEEAVEFLRGVASRGRFANAYLLHGPPGVGKGTAAISFARALLCRHASGGADPSQASLFASEPAPPPAVPGEACGLCPDCVKSADLQHPDLRFLFPVVGEERKLDDTVGETLAAWRENPWFVFGYEKAASIRLSMTRELLREMAYRPYEAARRVVVVRDADRMREDQYSAMLKSIEEPGAYTVWILTTSRPTRLPATIRSRCQRVRFRPLAETAVRDFLRERLGITEQNARMLAALSSGSLGRALVLSETVDAKEERDRPIGRRNQALELLEPAQRGRPEALFRLAQATSGYGKTGRETVRRLIEYQILWQRDLLRARYGAPREQLVHRDREPEIRRQAEHVDATEVRRRLMVLEEALRSIEGNISMELALFSAMSRLADPALSDTEWPRHPTARWRY